MQYTSNQERCTNQVKNAGKITMLCPPRCATDKIPARGTRFLVNPTPTDTYPPIQDTMADNNSRTHKLDLDTYTPQLQQLLFSHDMLWVSNHAETETKGR